MSDPEPQRPPTPAERLFLDHLVGLQEHGAADFDALCEAHPEHEPELRALHGRWEVLARMLAEGGDVRTVPDRLAHAYGPGVDPGVALDRAGTEPVQPGVAGAQVRSVRWVRYDDLGEFARGGMGEIRKVHDAELRRTVALKRIGEEHVHETDESRSRRALARFLEEAQITGQLVHPGIVPVHELGIDAEGRVYFTMQLVRGADFDSVIARAREGAEGWSQTRALGVLLKVCEAVAYAHSKGVVHRDLKPSNVMVGRFGEVYVMDWGLAHVLGTTDTKDIRIQQGMTVSASMVETERKVLQEAAPDSPVITMDGDVIGTPSFMPPEQAAGRIDLLGPRCDVYAIGAMLYQLLCGRAPYVPVMGAVSPYLLLKMLLEGPPPPVERLDASASSELVAICNKAMAREPGDRYATVMEMARDIEAYLGRRPVSPIRPSLRYVVKLAYERNRKVVLTAAAALLVVAFLLVGDLVQVRAARAETGRLLDFAAAEVLVAREETLYPPTPDQADAMQAWLDEVDERVGRLDVYRAELAEMDTDGPVSAGVDVRRAVRDLERLVELRPAVAARLETARSLRERTIEAEAEAWAKARRAVEGSTLYGDVVLEPQLGLVPLEANPQGYQEFWHVLSGARPERDADGELQPTAETGIVLVLLPGGPFRMGAPGAEPGQPGGGASLEPFFVGKYEVTQAQWQRVMGANPSFYRAADDGVGAWKYVHKTTSMEESVDVWVTGLHPVESVTWDDCTRFVGRIDLRLLEEAEWEYAARGGSPFAYVWGETPKALEGAENVLDLSHTPLAEEQRGLAIRDGYAIHAPVGSFREKRHGFGLFDVLGNVSEWCADLYVPDVDGAASSEDDAADTETRAERAPWQRVFRGGSWYHRVRFDRVDFRQLDNPRAPNSTRGLRVARDLRRRP